MQNELIDQAPRYPIEAAGNALKLILMLHERQHVSLGEAAERLAIARSSAHRLFAMLQFYGFAMPGPGKRGYVPGRALIDVGLSMVRSMDIRTAALPVMTTLSRDMGETVYLGILDGANVLFIESVESSNPLRLASRTGARMPAYASALGRAMLAELSCDVVKSRFKGGFLPDNRSRSIRSVKDLLDNLKTVRRIGYALNLGDPEKDVTAIGVAIRDARGVVRAAMSIAAPSSRFPSSKVPSVAAALTKTAKKIGDAVL